MTRTLRIVTPLLALAARAVAAPADDLVDGYLAVHAALAADSTEGVAAAAAKAERAATALEPDDRSFYTRLGAEAKAVAAARDLAAAREAFKPWSESLATFARTRYRGARKLAVFSCDMARAKWVQDSTEPRNPYYGKSMLRCGERIAAARSAPCEAHAAGACGGEAREMHAH